MSEIFPKVAILLAAYNGEKYIVEQLDSILNQCEVNYTIFISVDKCSDSTLAIVQQYESKYPKIFNILPYGESYGSAGQNFVRLLCDVDISEFHYISFADQDDIWLPNKLEVAIDKMTIQNADGYSSNVTAFWESGRTQLVKKDYKQVEFDYLFESPGPGCTFLLTTRLANSIKGHLTSKSDKLKDLWLHDWYCYSYARFNDFKWFIDSSSLMKYRQHDSNEVGANSGWDGFTSRLSVILSGEGFLKVITQAEFIGQLNSYPVMLILKKDRLSMLKLSVISWKCRRQLSHKLLLSTACLFFAIKKSNHHEPE